MLGFLIIGILLLVIAVVSIDIDTAITFILDCGDSVDLTTKPSIPLD